MNVLVIPEVYEYLENLVSIFLLFNYLIIQLFAYYYILLKFIYLCR